MNIKLSNKFNLEGTLDLRQLPKGSILHIYERTEDLEGYEESNTEHQRVDFVGHKVNFATLSQDMMDIHPKGFVKKKILEEGGGLPFREPCTVFIAFSGYFDNAEEPFDVQHEKKPLEVELSMDEDSNHGLIPGLDIAIKSMLVGELSVFLLSPEVAYGEYGVPPRIPPKAQCTFFVKLIKKLLTSKSKGKIKFSEPNMYGRVDEEVRNLYAAGSLLYKSNNFPQAANIFRKAIWMLHKCRLADEEEANKQEKWLKKLYYNSAICYNKANLPLKACIACNELNRLQNLWNNSKALFQNAKALRMIGQYASAEKRLKRAMALCSDSHYDDMNAEMELLIKTKESCNQRRLIGMKLTEKYIATDKFKNEVDTLLKKFKENGNLCQLTLPSGLGSSELQYLREACIRENLFMHSIDVQFDTEEEADSDENNKNKSETIFALAKEDMQSCDQKSEDSQEIELDHENLIGDIL